MGGTPINLTLLVTSIYVVTYVMMDPIAGSLAATLVLFLHRFTFGRIIALLSFYKLKHITDLATANAPVQGYPLWQALLAFNVVMWIVQVKHENI